MDVKELRDQDVTQLNEQLITLLKEHFELRMQKSTSHLTDLSKLNKTKKANKHKTNVYNKPNLTEILPDAIGRFFVRITFLSYFLSTISFIIHPADLIKIEPNKNKIK